MNLSKHLSDSSIKYKLWKKDLTIDGSSIKEEVGCLIHKAPVLFLEEDPPHTCFKIKN